MQAAIKKNIYSLCWKTTSCKTVNNFFTNALKWLFLLSEFDRFSAITLGMSRGALRFSYFIHIHEDDDPTGSQLAWPTQVLLSTGSAGDGLYWVNVWISTTVWTEVLCLGPNNMSLWRLKTEFKMSKYFVESKANIKATDKISYKNVHLQKCGWAVPLDINPPLLY